MKRCLGCGGAFESPEWICGACGWAPQAGDSWLLFAPEMAQGSGGFDPEAFATLQRLEPGHFWFRARNRLLIWALARYFPDAHSFLEIGCGTGFVLNGIRGAFPAMSVSGSEVLTDGLRIARSRLNGVPLLQMDARRIPFDREFDVIGAFDVLEHIDDDQRVLDEMFRATRHGGGVLLAVPQHPALWSAVDDESFHRRRYRRGELEAKAIRAGFTVLRSTSFVTTLLPFALLSRLLHNRGAGSAAEFALPPMVNATFEHLLDFERRLIARGVSLPIGVSRLVVAGRAHE